MKIYLRSSSVFKIKEHLKELERVRTKLGYSKIRSEKAIKLRKRVKHQLECLRRYLPRTSGVKHPCDPASWEVKDLTEKQKEEYRKIWQSIVMNFNKRVW